MSDNTFYGIIYLKDAEPFSLTTIKNLEHMLDEFVESGELDPTEALEVWVKPGHPATGPGFPAEGLQVGLFVGQTDDLPGQGWTRQL